MRIYSMEYYLQKTYYKTASLISNSCKAVALLAGQTAEVSMLAYNYGRNLVCCFGSNIFNSMFLFCWGWNSLLSWWFFWSYQGLAYQLIDDVLDFTGTSSSLGKGSLSDIRHVMCSDFALFFVYILILWPFATEVE